MKPQVFRPSALVLLLAAAFAHMQAAADTSAELETIEIKARSRDQRGADDVYRKNVSSVYAGREYLERYRTDAAGDVFKGLNGVYNMNTRNAGSAITPNIRGISGKGRIPVTIDGTEQTVDVWMNNYGIADRNYVDPALFRSITVEKGPAMTRGVKSGVGGAVSIRTIEPADIIPEGKSWGVELKTEFSNNTAEPIHNFNDYLGKDYRTLPGNPTADGAGGLIGGSIAFSSLTFYGTDNDKPRTGSRFSDFKNDRNLLFSAAFKTDIADGLVAYSDRRKGTYFSGKGGFEGYQGNSVLSDNPRAGMSETLIPDMAELYRPGEQVPNSNVASRSLLLKNNWYLPRNQQINLHYMDTKVRFGEINPFINSMLIGYSGLWNNASRKRYEIVPIQGIDSDIRSRTYKLGYQWQPEGSRWIDLKADIWRVNTTSTRHQSGGADLAVPYGDAKYDAWARCFRHNVEPDLARGYSCQDLIDEGYDRNTPPNDPPIIDGANTVFSGSRQTTKATRTGFNISNRTHLSDQFSLTLSAHHQYEKLDESSIVAQNDKDFFGIMDAATMLTKLSGPRAGRRKEWGAQLSFDWQPTSRLKIEAGIRYDRFWAVDDVLARARARRDPAYAIGQGADEVVTGIAFPYLQIMTPEEIDAYNRAQVELQNRPNDWEEIYRDFYRRHSFFPDNTISRHNQDGNTSYVDSNGQYQAFDESQTVLYRPMPPRISEYRSRKFTGPVFENGMFEQRVANPQGRQGNFYRYLRVQEQRFHYHFDTDVGLGLTRASYQPSEFVENGDFGQTDYRKIRQSRANVDNMKEAEYVYLPLDEDTKYPPAQRLNSSAWSPMIALSYDLTDNSRLHLRWAQMSRFPSIYEVTNMTFGFNTRQPLYQTFDLKPERSTNWEVGYTYNFAPLWHKLREGDVRLTYFSNNIKNVIDTNFDKQVIQYDRKITQGIELQSRLDFGRFFMSLGGTYRLKQETCDDNLSFAYDMYYNSVPACIEGGIGATRFYQSIQPKYSLNLDLGMRLFGEKLELGIRGIHHSRRNSKQHDQLITDGFGYLLDSTGQAYHWHASTIWDAYARYRIGNRLSINLGVGNLTNRYYLDPMSNVPTPGPGRTVTLGIKARF